MMDLDDQFPVLRSSSLVKNPKNGKNSQNPNSSSAMNVPHVIPSTADAGVLLVNLLDFLETASSPVVPI